MKQRIETVDTDGMDEEDAEDLIRFRRTKRRGFRRKMKTQATSRASKRKITRNKLAKRKIIICEPCAWRFLLE